MAGWRHDSMDMGLSELRELLMDREACMTRCSPWDLKESDIAIKQKQTG